MGRPRACRHRRGASPRGHEVALVADEGGLAAPLASNGDALDVLVAGIERCGLVPGAEAAIAVDVAATQLVAADGYALAREGRSLRAAELVEEMAGWSAEYPIVSIEDALGEDDGEGWGLVTDRLADRIQVLGDDLFATSPERLRAGIRPGWRTRCSSSPTRSARSPTRDVWWR